MLVKYLVSYFRFGWDNILYLVLLRGEDKIKVIILKKKNSFGSDSDFFIN